MVAAPPANDAATKPSGHGNRIAPGSGRCGRQSGEPFFRGTLAVAIVLPAASIRVMLLSRQKKPGSSYNDPGMPLLILVSAPSP